MKRVQRKMRETRPQRMIELAISGMLPKSKMGKQMYRKLKVYAGDVHPSSGAEAHRAFGACITRRDKREGKNKWQRS